VTGIRQITGDWHDVTSAHQARDHIDLGILVTWQEVDTIRMLLDDQAEADVIRHFARRFVERAGDRSQAKIVVESVIVWLTSSGREKLLHAFLEEFFAQPSCDDACCLLAELALCREPDDSLHADVMHETAVTMICELCLSVQEYNRAYHGEFKGANAFLEYAAHALLSASDSDSISIRLSLLHYFGVYEHGHAHHKFLNHSIVRFGRSVLDHLFSLLLTSDCETATQRFLIENLTYLLEADAESQKIISDTFETFLMKNPNRMIQFLQAFADSMKRLDDPRFNKSALALIQHMGTMLKVVSSDDSSSMGRDLISAILGFNHWPIFNEALDVIRNDEEIPRHFVVFMERALIEMAEAEESNGGTVVPLRMSKRRRRQLLNTRASWRLEGDNRCVRCIQCCG